MKTLIASAMLVWIATIGFAADAPSRPDILILMPDQMRGDCLSLVGHPVLRTPHFDALAREGVLFRRAYSPVPSCIPARYALLTGQSPRASGVVGYHSRPIAVPTLPQTLGQAGYTTVLVGRTMHQSPPNKSVGYGREILGSTYVANDEYDRYLRQAAPQSQGIKALVAKTGVTYNYWEANPWPLADELHPTAWTVRQAEKIIAETPGDKPLFLTASFYSPHPPLFPPKKYFDAILARDLPKPAHGDWVDWAGLRANGGKSPARTRVLLEGEQLRQTLAGYFGLIEQLDDATAPLVAAFKARSEKAGRAWVIVLTSDHGEMLGDHGYFRKCEPYEGASNIPLVFAGSPGLGFRPGSRSAQPVALEDIMPTLLALAGAAPPKTMDGASLLPLLRGDERPVREVLHTEHAPCYGPEQAFHLLTDGHVKYIWRPASGREQLFDLDRDPREEHDLAKDAAAADRLVLWRNRLIARLADRPEGFSDGRKLLPGRPYAAIMGEKQRKGKHEAPYKK